MPGRFALVGGDQDNDEVNCTDVRSRAARRTAGLIEFSSPEPSFGWNCNAIRATAADSTVENLLERGEPWRTNAVADGAGDRHVRELLG